jgi:hypothetical protein
MGPSSVLDTKTDWPTGRPSRHNFGPFPLTELCHGTTGLLNGVQTFILLRNRTFVAVSGEFLWLRQGDSLVTQRKQNIGRWKPLPED